MKDTITEYRFVTDMTKEGYGFSRSGAVALFEYIESLEQDGGEELEYDPTAFRYEFTEYADLDEIKEVYDCILDLADLYNHTLVVEFDGGLIIQDF